MWACAFVHHTLLFDKLTTCHILGVNMQENLTQYGGLHALHLTKLKPKLTITSEL